MSGSAVVDQMLGYVWKDLKGQGQPAIDVLRSGLSMQPDPSRGLDSARLNLALSEVFAAEHNWGEAAACSQAAAAAAAAEGAAAADLAGLARLAAARTLLVAGRDADAAAAVATNGSKEDAVQLAQQLMVRHATAPLLPDAAAAASQQLQQALNSSSSSSSGGAHGVLLAVSHKVAGDLALAQGELGTASSSFGTAQQLLGGSSSSDSSDSKALVFESDPGSCLSSRLQQEVAADVALGAAQVCMARKEWEASEEHLSAALAAAEAAGGEAGPGLAPVLLLLGSGYARSARVMFAEGLLREAAKVLGAAEPSRLVDKAASSSRQLAHPSLAAAVAWRYCQLLTALPNRGAEAATWGDAARTLWQHAGRGFGIQGASRGSGGSGFTSLQEVLGDDVALTGKGQHGHGRGAVVSLLLRRLLPVADAPKTGA
ncbi:hypothetical protein OEZ85_006158 [Tetradesmus obliquus]|uniref:Protein ZIP4 homolog n=1 Tax=Tetradesmus obliquus TaxID=3088 RepID=A0ABY8UJG4_TETOB|nr:hypothetical protein OEZ85_006158 [Tetradesmus obliquus]